MSTTKMNAADLWERAVDFHGHSCGGLTIGYKACPYAMELLELEFSDDEEVVCIAENDACGIDAIQAVLGCSVGKGNLLFHLRGKQAFSFYNRTTGKSVRLVLKETADMDREEKFAYMQKTDAKELFDVKETTLTLPESARIFQSCKCDVCGEVTMESMLRLDGGKKVCLDCYQAYSRFDV